MEKQVKNVRFVVSATGYYIKWAVKFCENAFNLFGPEDGGNIYNYSITLITDTSSPLYIKAKDKLVGVINNPGEYHVSDIKVVSCPDFPWPVMTLYKPYLCQKYIEDGDDIVFCGNINIEMQPNDGKWYDDNKVNVSWHHKHPEPYFNSRPYYIQGGFICARADIMRGFCREWQAKINYRVNHGHSIPDWHDETVLNELFAERRNQFNPHFILCTSEADREAMEGQFALLNLEGKIDKSFKDNWQNF